MDGFVYFYRDCETKIKLTVSHKKEIRIKALSMEYANIVYDMIKDIDFSLFDFSLRANIKYKTLKDKKIIAFRNCSGNKFFYDIEKKHFVE